VVSADELTAEERAELYRLLGEMRQTRVFPEGARELFLRWRPGQSGVPEITAAEEAAIHRWGVRTRTPTKSSLAWIPYSIRLDWWSALVAGKLCTGDFPVYPSSAYDVGD
jgi:hypothetical protein